MKGLIKLGLAFVGGWSVARLMEAQLTGVPITPLLLTEWNKSVQSLRPAFKVIDVSVANVSRT